GQILAWMSSTERAALLDAARSQGTDEMKRWEELYRATPVIAPISGTIILRSVESGQTFTNTDAILVMSDRLTVKAQFDETDIAQVRLKQGAEIVLDAYSGEKFPAVVDQIAFEAKTVNNVTTYVVDVLPTKTPEFMRSGMTANVTVFVEKHENVIRVPAEAVQQTKSEFSVLVPGPEKLPVRKSFQAGLSDGKFIEVKEGLTESDTVLIDGTGPCSQAR
ncbi:MAG: HlyD family efflux transporter periplasmic adaptor subunit, partial [Oxalobacteraceae bacterium]